MRVFATVLILVLAVPAEAADYPKIELSTQKLKMTVYPPDSEKGFYRGSRFCWGGVMGDIEYGGFKLFHAWKDTHNPKNNDDIIGPVIEFGQEMALGYQEAKVGDPFVKIGVGELTKPKEEKYSFFTNYTVANPGIWKVARPSMGQPADWIGFRQTMISKTGYSYHLALHVSLADTVDGTWLRLNGELVNVGTKPIATDVYNHNFFNVDKQTVGPKYSISFADPVEATADSRFGERAKVAGKTLEIPKALAKQDAIGRIVRASDKTPYSSGFTLRYAESNEKGVSVSVRESWPNDQKSKKFQVWTIGTVLCPEPFHDIKLDPGEAVTWETEYWFEGLKAK